MLKLLVSIFVVAVISVSVAAQLPGNPVNWCRGGFFTRDSDEFRIATVKGGTGERTYFQKDDKEVCPGGKGCRGSAYLVGGDEVIVARSLNGFACSWYPSAKGAETVGWLPANKLDYRDIGTSSPSDWFGEWKYANGDITLAETGDGDVLKVSGNAFWQGLGDNVHVGELDGFATIDSGRAQYSEGDDEFACEVTMRLLGKYLIVADNLKCGGVNVTFSGIYRKASPKIR